jgi:chorismate mutase
LRFTFITVSEPRLPLVTLKRRNAIKCTYKERANRPALLFSGGIMSIRGVRGATTVQVDQPALVIAATQEMLEAMMQANPGFRSEDVASALFTVTDDIVSIHPAAAARQMGWNLVPMMCAQEIPVPGSLPRCIRVLIHWNTDIEQRSIKHIYLHEAIKLRPDLVDA